MDASQVKGLLQRCHPAKITQHVKQLAMHTSRKHQEKTITAFFMTSSKPKCLPPSHSRSSRLSGNVRSYKINDALVYLLLQIAAEAYKYVAVQGTHSIMAQLNQWKCFPNSFIWKPLLKRLQTALGIEHFRRLLETPNSEGFCSRKSDFKEMYEHRSLTKSVI